MGNVVGMGYFEFDGVRPVAGSCSVAVVATCHADNRDEAPRDFWQSRELDFWNGTEVGHCAFTDGLVRRPIRGRLYAGQGDLSDR